MMCSCSAALSAATGRLLRLAAQASKASSVGTSSVMLVMPLRVLFMPVRLRALRKARALRSARPSSTQLPVATGLTAGGLAATPGSTSGPAGR